MIKNWLLKLSSCLIVMFLFGIAFSLIAFCLFWLKDLKMLFKENMETLYLYVIYFCILKGLAYALLMFQTAKILGHIYENSKIWTWGIGQLGDLVLLVILLFFVTIILPIFSFWIWLV